MVTKMQQPYWKSKAFLWQPSLSWNPNSPIRKKKKKNRKFTTSCFLEEMNRIELTEMQQPYWIIKKKLHTAVATNSLETLIFPSAWKTRKKLRLETLASLWKWTRHNNQDAAAIVGKKKDFIRQSPLSPENLIFPSVRRKTNLSFFQLLRIKKRKKK
jgi:hypothetical protein